MSEQSHYLVRHGRHNFGLLTSGGVEDAGNALSELTAKDLGAKALILSSSALSALQTAEIIGKGLEAEVVPSARIWRGGENPKGIDNLDGWFALALEEAGAAAENGQELIVVTHAPLIAVATGRSTSMSSAFVTHGGVYRYEPNSWSNPDYDPAYAGLLEEFMGRDGTLA